jgi:hypothetical protein
MMLFVDAAAVGYFDCLFRLSFPKEILCENVKDYDQMGRRRAFSDYDI